MYKIAMINMPFASANMPSLALTQLKAVSDAQFDKRASMEVHYFNQDFANYIGFNLYQSIAVGGVHHNTGLGEWFFRQVAFPTLPDNTDQYFQRYYPFPNEQTQLLSRVIREKRRGLNSFLDELIVKYQLDQADLVGFTSMFSQNTACFALARKLKELHPETTIIMGGANCETPMGQEIVKNVEYIDFAFSGPSLKNFPEFLEYNLAGELQKCHRINGVFSRRNCVLKQTFDAAGNKTYTHPIGQELDINTIIELDYEAFLQNLKENFPGEEVSPILFFETSRGCWWGERAHCTFCGLNGLTMNYRSMKSIESHRVDKVPV